MTGIGKPSNGAPAEDAEDEEMKVVDWLDELDDDVAKITEQLEEVARRMREGDPEKALEMLAIAADNTDSLRRITDWIRDRLGDELYLL